MQVVSRFRGIVAVGLFLLTIVSIATAKYSGGTGEPNDPYQIATAADLMLLGDSPEDYDKHFLLTADIDLDPNLPGRKVFDKAVIAPDTDPSEHDSQGTSFTGVFDGNDHTISHLTIQGKDYVGLFGLLGSGGEITKTSLAGVNVTGSGDYVGGLVGYNSGAVTQCYSAGAVSGKGGVGGLMGANEGGNVTQCYSTSAVSGKDTVGGLVGTNMGTVIHCYSSGSVSGTGEWSSYVGGLVGYNWSGSQYFPSPGIVTGCYSAGAVSGTGPDVGGLVGSGGAGVTACFWDIQTSGQARSAGGTGLTTAQVENIQTHLDAGWDFIGEIRNGTCQVWQMPEAGGYPVLAIFNGYTPPQLQGAGTPEDPYLISDALELGAMHYYSAYADYRLAASIDLSSIHWGTAVIPRFGGVFDGNNLTISHLMIAGGGYLGLFGQLASGGEVKNLGLLDVNVAGSSNYVGGLVGENSGDVTQCHSSGSVTGTGEWLWYVGGLIGRNNYGTVTQCHSTGGISSTNNFVGGLMGANRGTVTRCYSSGSVSGTGVYSSYVGGLMGDNGGIVAQCYSSGSVRGTSEWSWYVGGLMGANGGTVTQCYSTGAVSGGGSVGGLAGANFKENRASPAHVSQCYSAGSVSGKEQIGGLAGSNSAEVANCLWDTQTSCQATSAGGTARTTTEMQTASTFLDAGWDFVRETANGTEDVWWILDGRDYPRLWWERVLGDDFEDGKAEPLWMLYEPEPQRVRLKEVNGRLEVEAVTQTQNVDAVYVTLSGGSEGMALVAGDAWLDNFVLNAGVVQSVEPARIPDTGGSEPDSESQ